MKVGFIQAIGPLENWKSEVLKSLASGYNNGFVKGLNNQTKFIKCRAFCLK
ncbi:transposase [Amphibacillus jilinensis]|uniref:transposase n=1 Tax=Amphibacillus jilinensis TaxID=1216008 RepID=UPI0011819350